MNFTTPITLDNLEIIFVNENNELYDFNGLMYNLSFKICILESNTEKLNF